MPASKITSPPPAYFLSLSLENVRSFGAKQTVYFTEGGKKGGKPAQWTVILGDNGVGKSTVLKALAAMRPTELEDYPDDIKFSELRGYKSYSPAYSNTVTLKWSALRHGGETKAVMSYKAQYGGNITDIDFVFSFKNLLRSDMEHYAPEPGRNTYKYFGVGEMGSGLICYGYGAGRTVGNSTLSETPEAADTCASLFDDRADLLNPEEWFLFADYRIAKDKDPLTTQNFRLIKEALLKVMAEGEITDLEVVAPGLPGRGSPRQGVRFQTPYGWVRLRDMSLGYQTLVVWLTDLADKLFVRYPDSDNPLEMPAIVLIDEIDLHLHPSWQRKLLKSLSEIFTNTQFIATAHSPLVVQAAGDEGANVVLLRREGDQTIVVQNLEDVRGWRIDQIMTSELFGLETARSLDTEKKMQRRVELLTKAKRTAAEKKELETLTHELNAEPLGETPSEREVHAVLQELRQRLAPKGLDASAA